jgi:sulfatase modifying factor 1
MKLALALAAAAASLAAQAPAPPAAASNSIGMTFIRIEPGTLQVGVFHPDCDNGGGGRGGAPPPPRMVWDEADRAACEAQTKADRNDGYSVTIAKPYSIAKTEVTQGQWKALMAGNPSLFQGDRVTNPDNHPVERVSWQDTQAFVKALNAKEKTKAYRLPTEFEWEYACRAGGPGQQAWTDIRAQAVLGLGLAGRGGGRATVPAPPGSEPLPPETPAQYTARTGMTNEVGLKAPNAWGVHDMLGNVWEWVADPYNGKIFPDPTPPKAGSPRRGSGQAVHVLKGGGFASDVKNAICATHGFGPGDGFAVGFRIVKDVR